MKRLYAYRCGTWAKDKGSSESARAPLEKIRAEGKFARRRERRMKKKDEETDRRKSGREKRKEGTEKVKRERKRGRNREVKADRYSWTIQVAQQPAGSGTLSLLGPGSLEPVRLVSVFASIGSILRSSSVVHPSSTLFPFAFSFLFSLSLSFFPLIPLIALACLFLLQCVFRRLVSFYFVPAAFLVLRYISRYSWSLQSSVASLVIAINSG